MPATARRFNAALHRIAARLEPGARRAFIRAAERLQGRLPINELAAALARGDLRAAELVINANTLPAELRPLVRIVNDGFARGGRLAADDLRAIGQQIRFDADLPHAVRAVDRYGARLVRQVSEETRAAIRAVLRRSIRTGIPPYEAARLIRPLIGLTSAQTQSVVSYFQALIQEGTSRDRAQVLADRYAARRLRERAINIARTETLGALNKGQLELWDQAKRLKLIGTRSRKEWIVTPDDRLAIVGPRTLIATINGWRPVATIDVGDLVLTHRDRFCRVTLVESKRYDGPTVRIRTGKKGFRATHLTYGHPVLVRRGSVDLWVLTEHLVHGDAVYVTGRPCVGCGTVIAHGPEHRDRDRHCHACNTVKVNATRWAQPAAHEQLSAQNRLRWSDPHARRQQSDRMREAAPSRRPDVRKKLRDAALTRFMDPAQHAKQTAHNRRTARLPSHPFNRQTPSERDAIRAMALKARAQKSRGMSCLERKMRWFLEQQHIAFEAQWPFRANGRQCFADFYLPGPRVVIECDGWAHGKPEVQARDVEKDVALAAQGVRVLRFSDRAIRADFLTVANAVQAHCCFVRVTPTIEHRVVRTTVYHLTVDGDESFVAGGVVVHNCPICEPLDGVTVPIDEPFITSIGPVHAPPVHPRCRCAMSLRAE